MQQALLELCSQSAGLPRRSSASCVLLQHASFTGVCALQSSPTIPHICSTLDHIQKKLCCFAEEATQSQSCSGRGITSTLKSSCSADNFRMSSGLYVTTQQALTCIQIADGCSRTSKKLTCARAGPDATIQPVLGCPGYGLQPCIIGPAFQSHLHAFASLFRHCSCNTHCHTVDWRTVI